MRVGLVDVDSKIANLALMELSAYHKAKGDSVSLYTHRLPNGTFRRTVPLDQIRDFDRVYQSCIFTWNADESRRVEKWWRTPDLRVGGTGYDHGKAAGDRARLDWGGLEPMPDYSIYGVDYATGFCNRGCNRKCEFCDVWRKEGTIKTANYRHPSVWVPDGFKKAMLLDNDPALYPFEQQAEIYRWFKEAGVRCSITQGFDIRCVAQDERLAPLVHELRPWNLKFTTRRLYIAWDYMANEAPVRRGIERLLAAGFKGSEICAYTIVGGPVGTSFFTTMAQNLYRHRVLWEEYGVLPYAMPFNNRKDDPVLRHFCRWTNRVVFKACSWEDYLATHGIESNGEGEEYGLPDPDMAGG